MQAAQAELNTPDFEPDTTGSEETQGEPAGATVWDADTMAKVAAFADKMDSVQKQREETNADKAAAVAELVNLGFNKDALSGAPLSQHARRKAREFRPVLHVRPQGIWAADTRRFIFGSVTAARKSCISYTVLRHCRGNPAFLLLLFENGYRRKKNKRL